MDIDLQQLPIPDWGLLCPKCRYPLKGLPSHRCPECGEPLDIPELVRSWTRLRGPRFFGDESPLPDYGLTCAACDAALAGAERSVCPGCGEPFDAQALRPPGEWFILDRKMCAPLAVPGAEALLAHEGVPHFEVKEDALGKIWGTQSITVDRLWVASEFYFEVLWLLARARREVEQAQADARTWVCQGCREENPGHFEVCWNCGHPAG
jgi:predicted amidophosphoribosyltransferase